MQADDFDRAWNQQVAELFARRRPAILERVAVIERLAENPSPTAGEIEEARAEAHKLRGLLGTIGLPAGSESAGEVEDLLAEGNTGIEDPLRRLSALVREHEG